MKSGRSRHRNLGSRCHVHVTARHIRCRGDGVLELPRHHVHTTPDGFVSSRPRKKGSRVVGWGRGLSTSNPGGHARRLPAFLVGAD
jgi:hypothetical protein